MSALWLPAALPLSYVGVKFAGCYEGADVVGEFPIQNVSREMTVDQCFLSCAGNTIALSVLRRDSSRIACTCGDVTSLDGFQHVADAACDLPCPAQADQSCGSQSSRFLWALYRETSGEAAITRTERQAALTLANVLRVGERKSLRELNDSYVLAWRRRMSDHTRLIRNIGTVGDFDQIVLGGNGQAVAFEGTFEAQNEPAVAGYALAQGSGPKSERMEVRAAKTYSNGVTLVVSVTVAGNVTSLEAAHREVAHRFRFLVREAQWARLINNGRVVIESRGQVLDAGSVPVAPLETRPLAIPVRIHVEDEQGKAPAVRELRFRITGELADFVRVQGANFDESRKS
ncbi:MAG: WSC domain-containing protein, partial [Pseudomonadales bacterium]